MKLLKTITKLGMKNLYISQADLDQLFVYGVQGQWISEISDVAEAIRCLNILAMKEHMFPAKTPLELFTDFGLEDTKIVVVGGVPSTANLGTWLGAGFCHHNASKVFTTLHDRLMDDFNLCNKSEMKPSLYSLRTEGVLLLHDVLSTTAGQLQICLKLWEPFIWQLLHKMSMEYPLVPIVFATSLSDAKFSSAVVNSKYVFRINLLKETKDDGIKVFNLAQAVYNKGKKYMDQLDIPRELRK